MRTKYIDATKYPKFHSEWKLYDITGMISASTFMRKNGLSSAKYIYSESLWVMSEEDATMFILRWA